MYHPSWLHGAWIGQRSWPGDIMREAHPFEGHLDFLDVDFGIVDLRRRQELGTGSTEYVKHINKMTTRVARRVPGQPGRE